MADAGHLKRKSNIDVMLSFCNEVYSFLCKSLGTTYIKSYKATIHYYTVCLQFRIDAPFTKWEFNLVL